MSPNFSLRSLIPLLLLTTGSTIGQTISPANQQASDVISGLKNNSIIPTFLPEFTPSVILQLEYGSSNDPVRFPVGGNVSLRDTSALGNVSIIINPSAKGPSQGVDNFPFTCIIIDVDSPLSEPNFTYVQYIGRDLTTTVKSNDSAVATFVLLPQSPPILPYQAPIVGNGERPHRLVGALYAQSSVELTPPPTFARLNRSTFSLQGFVDGFPVGASELVGATVFYVGPNVTGSSSSTGSSTSSTTSTSSGVGSTSGSGTSTGSSGTASPTGGVSTTSAGMRIRIKNGGVGWCVCVVMMQVWMFGSLFS